MCSRRQYSIPKSQRGAAVCSERLPKWRDLKRGLPQLALFTSEEVPFGVLLCCNDCHVTIRFIHRHSPLMNIIFDSLGLPSRRSAWKFSQNWFATCLCYAFLCVQLPVISLPCLWMHGVNHWWVLWVFGCIMMAPPNTEEMLAHCPGGYWCFCTGWTQKKQHLTNVVLGCIHWNMWHVALLVIYSFHGAMPDKPCFAKGDVLAICSWAGIASEATVRRCKRDCQQIIKRDALITDNTFLVRPFVHFVYSSLCEVVKRSDAVGSLLTDKTNLYFCLYLGTGVL